MPPDPLYWDVPSTPISWSETIWVAAEKVKDLYFSSGPVGIEDRGFRLHDRQCHRAILQLGVLR